MVLINSLLDLRWAGVSTEARVRAPTLARPGPWTAMPFLAMSCALEAAHPAHSALCLVTYLCTSWARAPAFRDPGTHSGEAVRDSTSIVLRHCSQGPIT